MRKICCFAGHREIYCEENLFDKSKEVAEKLIVEEKVNEFWFGNYGYFDAMSASAVRELKGVYHDIEINLIIPYVTAEINEYKEVYYKKYDNILIAEIPEKTPRQFKILKCNQYMVKNSDFLICYVKNSWGGAYKNLEYAKKQNIKIINLADN